MKIKYFEDTDTALLQFRDDDISETKELSEDVYLDLDEHGQVISITLEHASHRGDLSEITFSRIPATSL